MTYFHYTCTHGLRGIGEEGKVMPMFRYMSRGIVDELGEHRWMAFVSWFTDLDVPDRNGLGLTSNTLKNKCDRTRYRYIVEDDTWLRRWVMHARDIAPRQDIHTLNSAPGALPMHWWVSAEPVPVHLDRDYRR